MVGFVQRIASSWVQLASCRSTASLSGQWDRGHMQKAGSRRNVERTTTPRGIGGAVLLHSPHCADYRASVSTEFRRFGTYVSCVARPGNRQRGTALCSHHRPATAKHVPQLWRHIVMTANAAVLSVDAEPDLRDVPSDRYNPPQRRYALDRAHR